MRLLHPSFAASTAMTHGQDQSEYPTHPSRTLRIGQRRRHLQESLRPNEIVTKVRPQRIPLPPRAMHFAATLAYNSVIHNDGQRLLFGKATNDSVPNGSKQGILVHTLTRKHPVCRRPVLKLIGSGAKHTGYRPLSHRHDGAYRHFPRPLIHPILLECGVCLRKQILESIDDG